MQKKVIIFITLLIIAAVGIIAYLLTVQSNSNTTPIVTATPTANPQSSPNPASGSIQEDTRELGYTLQPIPEGYVMERNDQFSRMYLRNTDPVGAGPTNFVYISVIPKGKEQVEGEIYNYNQKDFQLLNKINVGQKTVVGSADKNGQSEYFTYERVEDTMIGGFGAKAFKNTKPWEFPQGTTEYRYIIPFTQATFLVGGYVGTDTANPYHISKSQMDQLLTGLKITPETISTVFTSPVPEGDWKQFTDKNSQISFSYPSGWSIRKNGQSFPDGDLFSLFASGATQRTETEMHDGVVFSVMKPAAASDIKTWIKQRYETESQLPPDSKPQYSQVTYSGKVYEKVVVCGLGCFTYYHTIQNGKVYGFMVSAVGPHQTEYEAATNKIISSVKYE